MRNNNVMGSRNVGHKHCDCDRDRVEDIVSPTNRIVNTRTRTRTIRRIHPTEVINVNRTIIRNENFYPVMEREVNETVVEDFDCGRNVNNPRCRRANRGLFRL